MPQCKAALKFHWLPAGVKYSEVVKQLRGPDFDPSLNPIDAEALMISGGGKSGTVAMCVGFVPITKTLSQIKARQTSSTTVIRQCVRPDDIAIEVSFPSLFLLFICPWRDDDNSF